MTMLDMKCDVCGVNPPVGVASTIIPYSCAYCVECLKRDAQPEIVFSVLLDDAGKGLDPIDIETMFPDNLVTFKNGKYMTMAEWAALL
jgi:hypothetical protein